MKRTFFENSASSEVDESLSGEFEFADNFGDRVVLRRHCVIPLQLRLLQLLNIYKLRKLEETQERIEKKKAEKSKKLISKREKRGKEKK